MYKFSLAVKKIIDNAKKRTYEANQKTMGTEYLLLEMLSIEDGIFSFLMNEYDVTKEEVLEETNRVIVLRSSESDYNTILQDIFMRASYLANEEIKEEHLLKALLEEKECIALRIITNLGLSSSDLIADLEEIYDYETTKEEVKYTTNLTQKALNNEFDGLFEYDNYLYKLEVILNKKYKNNPLIIGEAGVGKSAIVEGYAAYLTKTNKQGEVLELNLSMMLANTKYRGDFEGRLEEVLSYLKEHPNSILFIDEIHTIMGAGGAENSLDVANILKPFLARSDLKIIGATTLDEYHKTIYKDKALRRRFDPVLVKEPDLNTTKKIMVKLKESYEKFHKREIDSNTLDYLIEEADKVILNKARPDKCIDILDEVMSYANCHNNEIDKNLVDYILEEHIGYKKDNQNLNYLELQKLSFLSENNLKELNNYNFYLGLEYDEDSLVLLKEDLKTLFGFNEELTLELDLKQYPDFASMQTLLGAPPGFVGYQEEGLLSRQIAKYPLTLLILKNVTQMSMPFRTMYNNILTKGYFFDSAGRRIMTKHVVILELYEEVKKEGLGFMSKSVSSVESYDLILPKKEAPSSLNESYNALLEKYELDVKLDFKVNHKHQKALNSLIYNLMENYDDSHYAIVLENFKPVLIKH